MSRKNGILLHITSLPSRYGIGSLGKAAYEFVDALHRAKQGCWQILPAGPLSRYRGANNPYQGRSAFANNPFFIDLDMLVEEGFLDPADFAEIDFGSDPARVDYAAQFREKPRLLRKAYENGISRCREDFFEYQAKNAYWLIDYAIFVALHEHFGDLSFRQWPEPFAAKQPEAVREFEKTHGREIESVQFSQFLYERQWQKLKAYANEKGISIIGDMPFYVSPGSVEEWATPNLFRHDGYVGGAPPDAFSEEGQIWENSLYDWDYLWRTGYLWWVQRMARLMELFDLIRVDHFRGFESFYAIPGGRPAREGHWMRGPGIQLFQKMEEELGPLPVIAEDLGFLTPEVFRMLRQTGFMGTKVLQFAFYEKDSLYLPHHYDRNCVVYTGTHDNATLRSWYDTLPRENRQLVKDYVGIYADEDITNAVIRLAMGSVADLCVLPMQDILQLGEEARMNFPSTPLGNWTWRMTPGSFTDTDIGRLAAWTETYGRAADEQKK